MLSLREAAQLCGRGKSTIQAAIKEGKLSAGRNERGGYQIDPSELHRFFPFSLSSDGTWDRANRTEADRGRASDSDDLGVSGSVLNASDGTGQNASEAELRVKYLEELLTAERAGRADVKQALQARVDDLQATVLDLRKRLDQAEEEKMRLLPSPDAGERKARTRPRGLWARLTGR
ncbi:helix-turn-helix domain-containing protein [Paracoccus beibuensis]|uniref:helix-turn-helix domain-containing protein n=1 Tax=Paracoccus beibuensis TaxID=547602 RepID=UPI003898E136